MQLNPDRSMNSQIQFGERQNISTAVFNTWDKPFFQAKLTNNNNNVQYGQEADAIASKGIMTKSPFAQSSPIPILTIQRKCEHCEEEEKQMQRKEMNSDNTTGDHSLESYIGNLSNSGRSLPDEVRSFYEPRFGCDFSNVKVHTDTVAARSAQSINALAYTSGNNIIFNRNQYSPNTDSGKKLLGHELTHVVQQHTGYPTGNIQRACGVGAIGTTPTCNLNPITPPGERFLFKANCDEFAPGEQERLSSFASGIDPNAGIDIMGMASSDGDRGFNESLSCKRAQAVRNELINSGIPISRFGSIVGTGPIGEPHDASMRAGAINLVSITSQTVQPSPGLTTRTRIGVGENVNLTHSSGNTSTTWSPTAGELSSNIGDTTVFTAPDTAQSLSITAGGATITFEIVAPLGVIMERVPGSQVIHNINRPDSGILARTFLFPDDVNFTNVIYHEVNVAAVASPGGPYSCTRIVSKGHCPPIPLRQPCDNNAMTNIVAAGKGTRSGAIDCAYSGDCGVDPPFRPGNTRFAIPYEYKIGSGPFHRFTTVNQIHVLAPGGIILVTTKAGAIGTTSVSRPTFTVPRCGV